MPDKIPPPPTEAGPELDAWLAKWLMGWKGHNAPWWHPSTSTSLALDEVARTMGVRGYRWSVDARAGSREVLLYNVDGSDVIRGVHGTARNPELAAAFCLAAANAVYAESQHAAEEAKENP